MEIGTEAAQSFSKNICFKFSVLCLCSVGGYMLSILAKEKRVIGNGIHFCLAGMSAGVLTADHHGDISPQGHLQLRINQ